MPRGRRRSPPSFGPPGPRRRGGPPRPRRTPKMGRGPPSGSSSPGSSASGSSAPGSSTFVGIGLDRSVRLGIVEAVGRRIVVRGRPDPDRAAAARAAPSRLRSSSRKSSKRSRMSGESTRPPRSGFVESLDGSAEGRAGPSRRTRSAASWRRGPARTGRPPGWRAGCATDGPRSSGGCTSPSRIWSRPPSSRIRPDSAPLMRRTESCQRRIGRRPGRQARRRGSWRRRRRR